MMIKKSPVLKPKTLPADSTPVAGAGAVKLTGLLLPLALPDMMVMVSDVPLFAEVMSTGTMGKVVNATPLKARVLQPRRIGASSG